MTDKNIQQLEDRINDLECKLAFQEQTIDELNDALSQQQFLITRMQDQMKFCCRKSEKYGLFEFSRSNGRDTSTSLLM